MRIKLELISDLCTSSGDTVSGIIDTEICYDENGIPYIPAKRVKGCLKEAALELKDALGNEFDEETFKKLFGKSGDDRSASLVISNGYIENYNNISKEIKMMKISDKKYYYQKQFIVENYTSLRTNTRVDRETLTAEEDTLRITRVIDRGNTFYFDINDLDKQEKDFLEKVCKV
ncbi:MAG TPA: RAMP superfamily CRISPR-associated protein, partial [Petrotogaceae bacterium]|nr:RAMP superfamily CRISPR-associated protein [Petrotogaceae bacterium]